MAQVPYQPVPEVNPSDQGVHLGEAPAIPNAFGLNISKAVEGFGSTLQQSGNELANRALAIQHDKNSADADAADVEFMKQAGLEHAKYSAMEGKERVEYYQQHVDNLEKIRNNVRQSLTNVDAQLMYDRQSRRTMGATIFSGARESAVGLRQYQNQTTIASLGMSTQQYAEDPSPATLAKIEQKAREAATQKSGGDVNDIIADNAAKDAVSHAVLKRIEFVARNQALDAKDIMDKQGGLLTPDDKVRANSIVTSQGTNQGGDMIANDVLEWGRPTETQTGKTMAEMEAETRRRVKELDPKGDLPFLEKTALAALKTKDLQKGYFDKRDNQQTITDLVGLVQTTNASTPFELFQDPKAWDAYSRMDTRTRDATVAKIIKAYQQRVNYDDGGQNFKILRGMASDNKELFMQTSPGDWKVSENDWKTLMNKRDQITKGAVSGDDPRVNRAMTYFTNTYGQTLDNMHVIGASKDPKNIYLFKGSLSVALDQWQQDHPGKAITNKDYEEIWGQLRGEIRQERGMDILGMAKLPWWDKVTPNWKMVLDSNPQIREQYKQQILKRRTTTYEPTEDELRTEYIRDQWKTFSPSFKKPE